MSVGLRLHVCVYVCVCIMYVCVFACMCIYYLRDVLWLYVFVFVCVFVLVCIYEVVCVYVCIFPMFRNDSRPMKRASFIKNHLWVTPFDPDQYFAAGKFIMQNDDGDNLERWANQGNSVEYQDIVVWYITIE